MDNQNKKENAGIYFIVGALIVAVAIMGFFYMDGNGDTMGNLEPAAGMERPVNTPNTTMGTQPGATGTNNTGTDNTTRQYNNELD